MAIMFSEEGKISKKVLNMLHKRLREDSKSMFWLASRRAGLKSFNKELARLEKARDGFDEKQRRELIFREYGIIPYKLNETQRELVVKFRDKFGSYFNPFGVPDEFIFDMICFAKDLRFKYPKKKREDK